MTKQVWKGRNVRKRKPGKAQNTLLVSTGTFLLQFFVRRSVVFPRYFACLFFVMCFCCGLFSFIFAWVKFTGKITPLCLGHCLGSKHISQPPPKPAWGTLCWFQLLGRVNLLGERDQRCIHSQWDSASLLFYLVSPDNCIIHAILEADPGNTVCLNQPKPFQQRLWSWDHVMFVKHKM